SDGIQNQGEAGIDCGGPCPACTAPSCGVPSSCKDGTMNSGETQVDCGGSSCNPCPNNTNAGDILAIVDGCSWKATANDFTYNGTNSATLKCSTSNPSVSIQIVYNGTVTMNSNMVMTSSEVSIGGTMYNM